MSSIITIISSSLLIIVFSTLLAITITGAIASKIAEIMGKRELSKVLDYVIMGLWLCSVVAAIVAFVNYMMN